MGIFKSFSFTPRQSSMLVTVLMLIAVGSAYFFWYVPVQQENIAQRQFRSLQRLETSVHEKIDNTLALLQSRMKYYTTKPGDKIRYDVIQKYMDSTQAEEHFSFKWNPKARKSDPKKPTGDTAVQVRNSGLAIRLRDTVNKVDMEIDYTFAQFFGQLFQQDIFDGYMLVDGHNIIYQTFPSGTAELLADSLKSEKSAFTGQQIKETALAGSAYKLFSQQIILAPGSRLTVAGLLKSERYNREKNQLPPNVGILLFILALSTVLALPWLKQFQLGSSDRITAADAIACMGVALFLTAIIFFAFLQYNKPLQSTDDAFDSAAEALSSQIDKGLESDIAQAGDLLCLADQLINCKDCKPEITGTYPPEIKTQLQGLNNWFKISQLYVLDQTGKELRNWLPLAGTAPLGNFSNREYYREASAGHLYHLGDSAQPGFTLTPVISRTTGFFTTVMCMPIKSKPKHYTAISFDLNFFKKAILTPGFRYSVIDEGGKVLYDSDTTKQLNENLLSELSNSDELAAGVHGRQLRSFHSSYAGTGYKVLVRPMQHLPFSIVIMENDTFRSARQANQFVFTFSMLAAFIVFMGLQSAIVFGLSTKKLYNRRHFFDMSWLGPRKSGGCVYQLALWTNIILIATVIVIWLIHSWCLWCTIFTLLMAADLGYYFQSFLYSRRYVEGDEHDNARSERRWMFKLLMVVTILGLIITRHALPAIILGATGLSWYWFVLRRFSNKKPLTLFRIKDPSKYFTLMTCSRLILTAGLPVIFFFSFGYNYHQTLTIRYRQLAYGQQMVRNNIKAGEQSLTDRVWTYNVKDTAKVDTSIKEPEWSGVQGLCATLFTKIGGRLTDFSGLDQQPPDSAWVFSNPLKFGRTTTWIRRPNGSFLRLVSKDMQWRPVQFSADEEWYKAPLYYLLFIGCLVFFGCVFHYVLRRLFGLYQVTPRGWKTIDDTILTTPKLNKLVFLIGPPGSGKIGYIKKMTRMGQIKGLANQQLYWKSVANNAANVLVADMILIPNGDGVADGKKEWNDLRDKALNSGYDLIIINHFEYDIKNPDSNRIKLGLLEELLHLNQAKIMIISTVHPVNFLDSLNRQRQEEQTDTKVATPEHDLERWHVLLGHFRIVIQSLQKDTRTNLDDGSWNCMLCNETASGHFLQALYKPILAQQKQLEKDGVTPNSIALKLGITGHYFYMYIWQSLTKEEKFLLYDLAEDGLVNGFDDYNLTLLISKGLVVHEDGRSRLFNLGFREFILTAIGQSEALAIQQEIKDNGNWSKLKAPLVLMIIALLVFLFTSQKEGYTDMLKYVAVITGGVPLIMQLFTLFRNTAPASGSK